MSYHDFIHKHFMDKQYIKHSLERVKEWVHDAMGAEASPQEIYDTIREAVQEDYYCFKHQASQAYELLALLNGNGKGHIKAYDDAVDKVLSCDSDDQSLECKSAWTSFWEHEEVWNADKDKVVKWQLPIEFDPSGELFVTFPDDLLEAANLKEDDVVEWNDNGDGSYTLRKVNSCEDTNAVK